MKNKTKFLLAFFLIAMLTVLFAISVSAAEPVKTWDISATSSDSVTAYLYNDLNNSGMYTLTISGTGNMENFSYPDYAPWYSSYRLEITSVTIEEGVTSIGNWAFSNCSSLTSIMIPDSVASIGDGAFEHCYSLTSIVIPEGVTYIGDSAFACCSNLTSITVKDGNTSYKTIDDNLYSYDGKTFIQYAAGKTEKAFTIPDGVTSIADLAFWCCANLTKVVIPDSVTSMGFAFDEHISIRSWDISATETDHVIANLYQTYAYGGEYKIVISGTGNMRDWGYKDPAPWSDLAIGFVKIESGVKNVGAEAFYEADLTDLELSDTVEVIGDRAFALCYSIYSIFIPNSVTHIGADAFFNIGCLESVYFEENSSLVSIGPGAFRLCYNLEIITLPESVMYIETDAFWESGLKSIVIPKSTISVDGAFGDCWDLTSITVADGNESFKSVDGILYSKDGKILVQYASGKNDASFEIPDGVTTINRNAFEGCYNLNSIVIPESVTYIGEGAFYGCSSLTSIVIPEGVTSIGNGAFYWCSSLTSIVIPEGVTSIGNYAFYGCSSFTSIVIPVGVTSIGEYAFCNCTSLTSIVIPEGVTYIGDYAFSFCFSLTIYCEATSQPSGWDLNWNNSNRPVVWDYKNTIQSEIFTFKGYSFGWTGSMAVGFDIDYEAIRLYEKLTGETLDFGVVFAGFDALGGNMPLDANGNAHADVVKFSTKGYDYIQYDFVITDMTEEYFDISFVISAYICNGAMTKFVQANGLSDTVTGISYNEAKGA